MANPVTTIDEDGTIWYALETKSPFQMTPEEKQVIDNLANAWNTFIELPDSEAGPNDWADFRHAVDTCHYIIGTRVARRVDPELWTRA